MSTIVLLFIILLCPISARSQDVGFHLTAHLLPGKTILKVKRNFHDPYLWVLAANHEIYRVNSQTLAVDDYTAALSSYNNVPYVDIAGNSKDTVFVALNSSNVLQYEKGTIKLIGPVNGVPGTVNSIGLQIGGSENFQSQPVSRDTLFLLIATDNGLRYYNTISEKMYIPQYTVPDFGDSKIYEASYRTTTFKDSAIWTNRFATGGDTINYQPVIFSEDGEASYIGYAWEGGHEFGSSINTVISVYDAISIPNYVWTNYYWGNNRGMFQNSWDYSGPNHPPAQHYLDGINVNKITTIFGLTPFGDPDQNGTVGLIKQNLLIGTDNGFYFSNSVYVGYFNLAPKITLFHDDELGNTVINDIAVNASSMTVPYCEDGVWLAANDGLYLLKPDYGKYLSVKKINAINFKNQLVTDSTANICSSITAIINTDAYTGNSVQWYKNGLEIPLASADSLLITTSGDYNAIVYDPCTGIHLESNHLQVTASGAPVFSFNYPDKLQYCDSTSTTLKTDYSSNYHYRWYTNGVLNGDTTAKYNVTQNGRYKVEVSACTNSWVPSKEIEVDLINLPLPQITADKGIYCHGDSAMLTLNVPADPAYTINWYQDGNLISGQNKALLKAGSNGNYTAALVSTMASCSKSSVVQQVTFISSPAFTFNYPDVLNYCDGTPVTLQPQGNTAYHYRWYLNGALTGDSTMVLNISQSGSYNVEVSACAGSWVPSKTIQVNFIKLPVPVIQADKVLYCIGDRATLSVTTPLSNAYTINWYRDNTLLTAQQNQTSLITTTAGNYSVRISSTLISCDQQSTVQPVIFNPEPTISIAQSVITTLCSGQPVNLSVSYTGGTIQWSTGETTAQITVKQSGTYKATITSAAGCVADTSITLQMLPLPVLTLKDTTVCTYTRQSVTLSAPPGFSSYSWNNGASVASTYLVSTPETVSLTVTDANGCQATQQVTVSGQCPDVHLPNTFTPNGDGINDNWDIAGLENDATVLVSVYNRYGTMVYQSRGYNIPWNGTSQAKKLPTATYYYIITAKNGKQTFSGSVTIIY